MNTQWNEHWVRFCSANIDGKIVRNATGASVVFWQLAKFYEDNVTYACIGETASRKKVEKQNAAAKILETLSKKYLFSEEVSEKCLVTENFF